MKNKNNKLKSKRTSIETAARLADGRSHPCKNCTIEKYKYSSLLFERICNEVCTNAFVRGFKKGYKYAKEKIKSTESRYNLLDKLPKEKCYSVWVGGGEVNNNELTRIEAINLANEYLDYGYDDVHIVKNKKK